jgi:AraC-like DNA-binding protein
LLESLLKYAACYEKILPGHAGEDAKDVSMQHQAQMDLAINAIGVASYPQGAAFGPRVLGDAELVWILRGSARSICAGREDVYLEPGDILFCPPGSRDSFIWDERTSTVHGFVHFEGQEALGWLPWYYRPDANGLLPDLLSHLLRCAGEERLTEQARRCLGLVLAVLTNAAEEVQHVQEYPGQHPRLQQMLQVLQEYWSKQAAMTSLPTEVLASRCGVSHTHLARICHEQLGMTPQGFMRAVRLDQAVTLLAGSNQPIHTIAERCGFVSPYHFSRVFKETYGQSPRACRQAILAGGLRPMTPLSVVRFGAVLAERWWHEETPTSLSSRHR